MVAQVGHGGKYFVVGFTQADHQAALGGHVREQGLELLEQIQAECVVRPGAGLCIQARHRLQVVVHHVRWRCREDLQGTVVAAAEVGCEDLDAGARRQRPRLPDAFDEVGRATVAQVIAVDAGDDDVFERQCGDRARQVARLGGVECIRAAVADVAERATPGALVTHDHERGRALAEAFADVRAGGFLANRVQAVLAQDALDVLEATAGGRSLDTDPLGLGQHLGRLFDLDGDARELGGRLLLGRGVVASVILGVAHDLCGGGRLRHGCFRVNRRSSVGRTRARPSSGDRTTVRPIAGRAVEPDGRPARGQRHPSSP